MPTPADAPLAGKAGTWIALVQFLRVKKLVEALQDPGAPVPPVKKRPSQGAGC